MAFYLKRHSAKQNELHEVFFFYNQKTKRSAKMMLFVPLRQLGKLQQEILNSISVVGVRLNDIKFP